MIASSRPVVVVEDDPFLRFLQVVLDPAVSPERTAAFAHFINHDLPDLSGWCNRIRSRIPTLYPAEVRFATKSAVHAKLPGASVLLVQDFPVGPREIAAAGGSLKIVQKYGTIVSHIDRAACESAGVAVLTVRRRANISTAEQAFALLLALARQLTRTANLISVEQLQAAGFSPTQYDPGHTPNGNWARIKGLRTLSGQQLGIIGLGEIGREVAMRAAAFGMRIVYHQRTRLGQVEEQRYQAAYLTLNALLESSDAVTLHLPRSRETRGFVGHRELSLVKPGALLINVSQPQLIERGALHDALASGRLGGCGMDTFYEEPRDPDDPLLQFPNFIVTPHLGGSPRSNTLDDLEEVLVNIDRTLQQR